MNFAMPIDHATNLPVHDSVPDATEYWMPTIEQRLNCTVGDLQTQLPTVGNAEE